MHPWVVLARSRRSKGVGLAVVLVFAATTATATPAQAGPVEPVPHAADHVPERVSAPVTRGRHRVADFKQESASDEARHVAHWAVDSGDNGGLPYVIIDKVDAKVFVFDASGRLLGAAPALLGMVRGDGSAEGIGDQKLSAIRPEDRTTPAGRFVSSLDHGLQGQEILWVDYDSALALHRVPRGKPEERRAERLASPTPLDNRISYGCINVPVAFYETVVSPAFTNTFGIVYILPEESTARELFGSYDVDLDVQKHASDTADTNVPAHASGHQ